ncbi:MAG: class I SAM-dependent methyltransferase [Candidatus Eremiobacteraeota bacterium]|nr:class I SAM-dependent methyltransferase [Candidatus Eremiobacteraeota bacterium]
MKEPFFEPIFRKLRIGKIIKYIPAGSIICDMGCGPVGEFLFGIKDHIKKGYGFDNLTNDSNNTNIILKKINIATDEIPLADSTVDVVTSLAVLEHLDNPLFMLKESYRILQPGGSLLLTTPAPVAKPILEFLAYRLHLISKREIDEHKHYFNREELRDIFIKAGFQDNNIKCSVFEFGFNNFVIAQK